MASGSRRELVNAKATTKYLEAFFDATRIQSEANDLDRDVKHAVEQVAGTMGVQTAQTAAEQANKLATIESLL